MCSCHGEHNPETFGYTGLAFTWRFVP